MNPIPYRQNFTLKQPLADIECWNLTQRDRFTLAPGHQLQLEHAASRRETVATLVDAAGKATAHAAHPSAYRFIIPNRLLGPAIGLELPDETEDLVGDILRYESGELCPEQAEALRLRLKRTGMLSLLQGRYARTAALGS